MEEEKVQLIEAGAFKGDIAAQTGYTGLAGLQFIACHQFRMEFRGRSAHAGGEPWNGVNTLDAAVASYANVCLLRQQMRPNERVHGVIEEGGTAPNVITDYTRMYWNVRSPSMKRCDDITRKVLDCCEAAAMSTGCEVVYPRQCFICGSKFPWDVSHSYRTECLATAATDEAHLATIKAAKGMGLLTLRVLIDEELAKSAREDFDRADE